MSIGDRFTLILSCTVLTLRCTPFSMRLNSNKNHIIARKRKAQRNGRYISNNPPDGNCKGVKTSTTAHKTEKQETGFRSTRERRTTFYGQNNNGHSKKPEKVEWSELISSTEEQIDSSRESGLLMRLPNGVRLIHCVRCSRATSNVFFEWYMALSTLQKAAVRTRTDVIY